jgi:predicted  nucleic acid-binding Zn-ribbon protein
MVNRVKGAKMPEQQHAEILLALSDIDLGILRLLKQLEELPHKQQILDVRKRSRELETKAQQVQKMAHAAARTLKLLTDETELNEAQMAQVQAALDKSSEYRETTALASEMEMLSHRKAKLEEDSLIQMEKQEKVTAVEAQVAEVARKLVQEEQGYTEAYRQAGGKLKQDIADLEHARAALVAGLPEEMAKRYTKALETKSGIGAARLIGNQCSGCYGTLSEGQLAKLQEGPPVGECPNCNRLMVTTGQTREPEPEPEPE